MKPQKHRRRGTVGMDQIEQAKESVVSAYLDANLQSRKIPLKESMNDLEKEILLLGLLQTRGHQTGAAALLGLKPTALFEKSRKHGIKGQRRIAGAKTPAAMPGGSQKESK